MASPHVAQHAIVRAITSEKSDGLTDSSMGSPRALKLATNHRQLSPNQIFKCQYFIASLLASVDLSSL